MKRQLRIKRHLKTRKRISGTSDRSRLSVFRSGKHIYAQVIDDSSGRTLVAENDLKYKSSKKTQRAYEVGKKLAEKAAKKKIKTVVFDRGGFKYQGRVAQLARGTREGGLKF